VHRQQPHGITFHATTYHTTTPHHHATPPRHTTMPSTTSEGVLLSPDFRRVRPSTTNQPTQPTQPTDRQSMVHGRHSMVDGHGVSQVTGHRSQVMRGLGGGWWVGVVASNSNSELNSFCTVAQRERESGQSAARDRARAGATTIDRSMHHNEPTNQRTNQRTNDSPSRERTKTHNTQHSSICIYSTTETSLFYITL